MSVLPRPAAPAAPAQAAPTPATPAVTHAEPTGNSQNSGNSAPAKPEPKPWETVNHKFTANGKEIEVPYSELLRRASMGVGAEEKIKSATQQQKHLEDAIRLIKESPEKAFDLLNIDKKDWAKRMLLQAAEEELMTPEERQWRQERAELEARAKKGDDLEMQQREAAKAATVARVQKELSDSVIDAMKSAKVPQTKETVKRLAQKMIAYQEAGYTVTPHDVMPEVIRDYQEELQALVGGANEDAIEQFLGPDIAKKLIKAKNKELGLEDNKALPRLQKPVKGVQQPNNQQKFKTPREWSKEKMGGKRNFGW